MSLSRLLGQSTLFFFTLLFIVPSLAFADAPCSVPPSASGGNVKPNVLILLDNSGSMTWDAYLGTYDEATDTYWYDPLTRYDGLFDPTNRYTYVYGSGDLGSEQFNTGFWFEEAAGGEWSGNFLNWASMGRIDVARKVLTGGSKVQYGDHHFMTNNAHCNPRVTRRYDDRNPVTDFNGLTALQTPHNTAGEPYHEYLRETVDYDLRYNGLKCGRLLIRDSANVDQGVYYVRLKVSASYEPTGVLHSLEALANVGVMHLASSSEGGYIAKYVRKFSDAHFDDVISWLNLPYGDIEGAWPQPVYNANIQTTWTPLAETLYEATRYFAQQSPYYTSGGETHYELADGSNPWRDPLYDEDFQMNLWCARNYVVIITDGLPTRDENIPEYVPGSNPPIALQDFDQDGADPCPCGIDTDYACTAEDCTSIYPFTSSGTAYLDDIAAYGFQTDLRTTEDMPNTQNIVTHTIYIFEQDEFGDVFMSKTAANGGGSYYLPETAQQMSDALEAIFGQITHRAQAASSVAVPSEPVVGDAEMIFVPYYKHTSWYEWHGNIRAFGLDDFGNVIDASGAQATDSDGSDDGLYDNPIWDAELLLRDRIENGGTPRTIFTYIPGTGQRDFDTSQASKTAVGPYLDVDLNDNGTRDEDAEVEALISYVRGNDNPAGFSDLRQRGGHYVGDIIHSSTIYVGAPRANFNRLYADSSYGNFANANAGRTPAVYVGANDSMLHCFDATTGEELWGYIPFNLLSHVQWLTDRRYCHVYYADLTCRVWDMNLGTTTNPDWKSVLVGGMRFGGTPVDVDSDNDGVTDTTLRSAIFALDVTDPLKPVPDAADPAKDRSVVMWEIENDRFGYTTSMPIAVKVGDSWYVVFGSGPKTRDGDGGLSQDGYTYFNARMFVVNPSDGSIVREISIGDGLLHRGFNNFFGNPVAVDFDRDYSVDMIYVGDAKGNMWRIKTYQESAGTKTYQDPSGWVIDVGGTDPNRANPEPLLEMSPLWERKPFFAKPAVTMDEPGRLWIYFGSGRYFCTNDNRYCGYGHNCPVMDAGCSITVQGEERSIFTAAGIFDRHWDDANQRFALRTNTLHLADLDERIIVRGPVAGAPELQSYAIVDEEYPDATIETDVASGKKGWYFRLLEPKERCLGEFRVYGQVVVFLTFNPANYNNDPCVYGTRSSNLYGVYYASGTSTTTPMWDLTGEGVIDARDLVVLTEAGSSVGAGILKLEGGGFAGGSPIIRNNVAYLPLGGTRAFGEMPGAGTGLTSWREGR